MFALKVILYYLAVMCIVIPTFTAMFRLNENEAERKSKLSYPWKLMRAVFYVGLVLLTIAVTLTIFC